MTFRQRLHLIGEGTLDLRSHWCIAARTAEDGAVSYGETLRHLQDERLAFRDDLSPVETCAQSEAANRTIRADTPAIARWIRACAGAPIIGPAGGNGRK